MRTIKGIRADLGFTQREFAKLMGVSTVSWNQKENGKASLLARELMLIHKMSGIPVEQIEIPK